MKTIKQGAPSKIALLPLIALASALVTAPNCANAQTTSTTSTTSIQSPQNTPRTVIHRDANSRTWAWTNYTATTGGQAIPLPHQIIELATGICHLDSNSNYVDSSDEIVLLPDGYAAATNRPASL